MQLHFYKYQSSGNSFILIDNLENKTSLLKSQIIKLCDYSFGVGSDGLIILSSVLGMDFEIIFYNPDGSLGFCANGSLCALHFFKKNKFIDKDCSFKAFDGIHTAIIENDIHLKIKGSGKTILELEKNEKIDKNLLRYLTVKVKKLDLKTNYFEKKEEEKGEK